LAVRATLRSGVAAGMLASFLLGCAVHWGVALEDRRGVGGGTELTDAKAQRLRRGAS
jgi:hypothetical protein